MKMLDFYSGWDRKIDILGSEKASESGVGDMQLAELKTRSLGKAFCAENGAWPIQSPPDGGPWNGG